MKYTPELRGHFWFAVDRDAGVELACWFESEITCAEIGRRTESSEIDSQYMNGIPVVPVDTPIPRPVHVQAHHPTVIRKILAGGGNVLDVLKRHRLNPSR